MLTHKRMLASTLAASVLLVVSGCATMFTPGIQAVPVASTPQGAEVFIDGDFVGITPIIVSVTANENHEVIVRLGEDEMAWTLERQIGVSGGLGLAGDVLIAAPTVVIGGGIALIGGTPCHGDNLFCGGFPQLLIIGIGIAAAGLVPIIVDVTTHAYYELVPKEITAEFE